MIYFTILLVVFVFLFLKIKKQIGRKWNALILKKVEINHISLLCRHCNSESFYKREALIPTTFLTFFQLPFLNQSGAAYECIHCGYIAWFSRPKETLIEVVHPTYKKQTLKVSSTEISK